MTRLALLVVLGLACSKSEAPAPGAASATAAAPSASSARKDPARARALIQDGAVIIDVRTDGEFESEHLPAARHIALAELPGQLDQVTQLVAGDRSAPIVVYCASGSRSAKAHKLLTEAGFTQVVNGGGLDDLQ